MNPAPSKPAPTSLFAKLTWAYPYLTSPSWTAEPRARPRNAEDHSDAYCQRLSGNGGITAWYELYPPSPAATESSRDCTSLSLLAFGQDLTGYPSLVHGGVIMTILDEAAGYGMIARERLSKQGANWMDLREGEKRIDVSGYLVTAGTEVKFLRPLTLPGSCGVKVRVLEESERRMRLEAVMLDEKERVVARAESLWVRIKGIGAKL